MLKINYLEGNLKLRKAKRKSKVGVVSTLNGFLNSCQIGKMGIHQSSIQSHGRRCQSESEYLKRTGNLRAGL